MDNQKVFNEIYRKNAWFFGSGSGSIATFNKPFIDFVNGYLESNPEIDTIVDVGCGDWQIAKHFKLENKQYFGIDISTVILEKTRRTHESEKHSFLLLDAAKDKLPKGDLIIVKDVVQHLSNKDVVKVITKLKDYKHVIICNSFHEKISTNKDIENGKMRFIDLRKPPFNAKEYCLARKYVETLYWPINLLRQGIFIPKIYKGIFVKRQQTGS